MGQYVGVALDLTIGSWIKGQKHTWSCSLAKSSSSNNKNLASKREHQIITCESVGTCPCPFTDVFCLPPPFQCVQIRQWACVCVHVRAPVCSGVCVQQNPRHFSSNDTVCCRRGHGIWTYAHLSFDEQKLRPEERGQHLDRGDSPKGIR